MNSNTSAQLQGAVPKYVARSRKNTPEENTSLSLVNSTFERRQIMKRKMRAMHERRTSRIETLRAQVRAGSYRVNTSTLAERILENRTHFMESTQE